MVKPTQTECSDTAECSGPFWRRLRNPLCRCSLIGLAGLLIIAGLVGGIMQTLEVTHSIEFCTSCHEMRENFEEYKKTIHYSNQAGVRALCSDCHVPKKNWFKMMYRKLEAGQDVWGHITGSIDTPEKFEAKRLEMAKAEWKRMKESDSIGCRNCHSFESMDMNAQDKHASSRHTEAAIAGSGKTCIDCHKGIAHKLPRSQEGDKPGEK